MNEATENQRSKCLVQNKELYEALGYLFLVKDLTVRVSIVFYNFHCQLSMRVKREMVTKYNMQLNIFLLYIVVLCVPPN